MVEWTANLSRGRPISMRMRDRVSRGWRLWRLLLLEADPGGRGVLFTPAEEGVSVGFVAAAGEMER